MDKEYKFHREIKNSYWKIKCYRNRVFFSSTLYQRSYYENLIIHEVDKIIALLEKIEEQSALNLLKRNPEDENQREFTLEELSEYDGSRGKPGYIAVDGVVYDVSTSPSWGGGTHFGLYGGKDLTEQFQGCHPGAEGILESLLKVGVIKK